MPRARTSESEDVVVVKKPRAPRARAASSDTGTVSAARKRAPRKTVAKKAAAVVPEVVPEPESVATPAAQRKAPTPIAAERRSKARTTKTFIAVIVFCLILTGAGVVVGMFDHGPIDVVAVVNNRNEQISRGEVRDANGQTVTSAVPVQTDNSGLRIADPSVPTQATPAPATPVATTTVPTEVVATSTAATSSTDTAPESTTRDSALKPAL